MRLLLYVITYWRGGGGRIKENLYWEGESHLSSDKSLIYEMDEVVKTEKTMLPEEINIYKN